MLNVSIRRLSHKIAREDLTEQDRTAARQRVLEKSCICNDLAGGATGAPSSSGGNSNSAAGSLNLGAGGGFPGGVVGGGGGLPVHVGPPCAPSNSTR